MLGVALIAIVIVALRAPIAVGLNATLTEHDAAGGSESAFAQVPLRVNSAGFAPRPDRGSTNRGAGVGRLPTCAE